MGIPDFKYFSSEFGNLITEGMMFYIHLSFSFLFIVVNIFISNMLFEIHCHMLGKVTQLCSHNLGSSRNKDA